MKYIWLLLFLFSFLCIPSCIENSYAQTSKQDLNALNKEIVRLYQAGKYAEATTIAKHVLSLNEKKFGLDHPHVGTSLNNLAGLYESQGHYDEAEPLYKRTIKIFVKKRLVRTTLMWAPALTI